MASKFNNRHVKQSLCLPQGVQQTITFDSQLESDCYARIARDCKLAHLAIYVHAPITIVDASSHFEAVMWRPDFVITSQGGLKHRLIIECKSVATADHSFKITTRLMALKEKERFTTHFIVCCKSSSEVPRLQKKLGLQPFQVRSLHTIVQSLRVFL